MASGSAADGLFRCVYDGCISGSAIERRPYHKNCGCALHKSRRDSCSHGMLKCKNVSYPIRRAWSEGCLALAVVNSCNSSPSSSPVMALPEVRRSLVNLCNEDEEVRLSLFKV